MDRSFHERDYAATVRAVREGLRLLADLPPDATAATPEQLASIWAELAAWKHGVPSAALPTYRPKMESRRIVEAFPENDPVRAVVMTVYEAARTPLP